MKKNNNKKQGAFTYEIYENIKERLSAWQLILKYQNRNRNVGMLLNKVFYMILYEKLIYKTNNKKISDNIEL